MITFGLLPVIERRISNLNVTVTSAIKGIKNIFKSFWNCDNSWVIDLSSKALELRDLLLTNFQKYHHKLRSYPKDTTNIMKAPHSSIIEICT